MSVVDLNGIADGIERRLLTGDRLDEREARLCGTGLRMLADNERLIAVADTIEAAIGMSWDDRRVMRAAARIKLMFDSDTQSDQAA